VNPAPARLQPIFVPRIWGAATLAPLFPDPPKDREPIGEVWLTGNDCLIATGPYEGHKLSDAWDTMPAEWRGTRLGGEIPFPLLVKFIFPEDKLSVQVHPDDDYARRREARLGGVGKTEMWYAVSARPGAEVRVGMKPDVTPGAFQRALSAGTVEECLERVVVERGDVIFVPAGTAHTIGPGLVLCEIQQNSDITYRVFDYNRLTAEGTPRDLHIEKALDVLRFGEQSGGKVEPVRIYRGAVEETYYVACRYFATERWEFPERIAAVTQPDRFELLIFLEGNGRIEWEGGGAEFAPAHVWLLPAALGAYQLAPSAPAALLRTYVPDVSEFARRLADQRVDEAAWSRLVYP